MAKHEWVKKIDLARFSPRERVMILITAISVAIFLLVYIYLPAHRQVLALTGEQDQLRKEVLQLEQQLDEAQRASERMKAFKRGQTEETAGLKDLVSRSQGFGPVRRSLGMALEELNRLAKVSLVEFLSVRPEKMVESGTLQVQPVLIQVRSTFTGMGRYLQMMENLPRMVTIQNIKMEADTAEDSYVRAYLLLMVYLEKD